MKKVSKALSALLMIAVLAAGCMLGYQQIAPISTPAGFTEKPVTINEAQAGPDLDLMLSHLKVMASDVHSVCSPGLEVTRTYLTAQLDAMGLPYVVEDYPITIEDVIALNAERAEFRGKKSRDTAESIRDYAGLEPDATHMPLKNVVVTLDCPDTDDAVIFVAHMDSVKFGPGAMDDTISCVALMEALRLQKDQPLKRDLVFLFSDGEEQGMLGAAMYVKSHPEMKDRTQMVVNFEARGNTGALLMFETTENNLGLVRHFANSVTTPVGFSIATQVYHMMSNDTDLSWFMMYGYPGINFSVIEGAEVYHTAEDTYEGFNRASAAHYLETATDIVRYMATADLRDVHADQDAVFFPFFKGNQVVMSTATAKVLGYAAAVLGIVAMALAIIRKRASFGGLLAETGIQLAAMILPAGIGFGVIKAIAGANNLVSANDFLRYPPAFGIFAGLVVVGLIINLLLHLWLNKKQHTPLSMAAGLIPLLLAADLGTLLAFPAASYLFFLPLLLLSATVILLSLLKKGLCIAAPICYVATVLTAMLLFTPIAYLVYVALNLSMSYAAVALAMIPASLAFGLLGTMEER